MPFITDQLRLRLDANNSSSYPGSGTAWNDLSGNGYSATLTNGPTYSSDFGGIFNFDGVNDYATIPFNSDFAASQTVSKTVQAWVRFDAMETRYFLGNLRGATTFDGWLLGTTSTGQLRFLTNANSEITNNTAINTVTTNTWYLVTAVFRLTNTVGDIQIYLNNTNVLSGRHGNVTTYTTGAPFQIGSSLGDVAGQDLYFDGSIGAVYSYNKALSAQEISDNYDATFSRFFPSTNINITETPATASALITNETVKADANEIAEVTTASALISEPTIIVTSGNSVQVTTSIVASATIPSNIAIIAETNINITVTEILNASAIIGDNVTITAGANVSNSSTALEASALLVEPLLPVTALTASATMPNATVYVTPNYYSLVKPLNPYLYIYDGKTAPTNSGYQTGTFTKGSNLTSLQDGGTPLNLVGEGKSWRGSANSNSNAFFTFTAATAAQSFDTLIATGNFTYEVWVKPLGLPSNNYQNAYWTFVPGGDFNTPGYYEGVPIYSWLNSAPLSINILGGNVGNQSNFGGVTYKARVNIEIKNGPSSTYKLPVNIDDTALSINNWHHVVVTCEQSGINANQREVRFWVDGQIVGTQLISWSTWTSSTLTNYVLGSNATSLTYMGAAWFDELAIYSTKLTNSQIIQHNNFINVLSPNVDFNASAFELDVAIGDHAFLVTSNSNIAADALLVSASLPMPTNIAGRSINVNATPLTSSANIVDPTIKYGVNISETPAIAYAERPEAYFLNDIYYQYVQTNIAPYRYVTFDSADAPLDYGTDADYSVVPTTIGGTVVNPDLGINGKSVKTTGSSYITDGVILNESEWNDSWGTGQNSYHSAFWFQRAVDDNSTTGLRVLWNLNGYKDNQHVVLYQYQNKLHMQFNNGSGTWIEQDTTNSINLFDYQRHFVVIEFDHTNVNNNTVRLYVDAVLKMTVSLGTYTGSTTNASSADSGPNSEANNRPRLSIGCLITPFASTALPVVPTNTKLIIDEVYWDKNSITSTMVQNLYATMPDKNNRVIFAEPLTASDELVMPSYSISSILSTAPLTASVEVVQPAVSADRQVVVTSTVLTATAQAPEARVFQDRIINADIFAANATFNNAGAIITIPGGPMTATVTMTKAKGVYYPPSYPTANSVPYSFDSIPVVYVRYLMQKSYQNSIPLYKEIK